MYPLVKPWAVFTDHDPDAPSTHSLVLKPSWSNGPREHVPLPKVDGRAGQIWRTSFLSSHLLDWSWRNPQLERRGTGTTGDRWSGSLEHCFYTSYFLSPLLGTSQSPYSQNIVSRVSGFGFTRSHYICSKYLPSISAHNLKKPHFLF